MKDYYYILGIQKSAAQDDIKKAYRKLSTKFHPDHNDGDKFFEERFKDINEAYTVLIDAQSRREYDLKSFGESFQSSAKSQPSEGSNSKDNSTNKSNSDFKDAPGDSANEGYRQTSKTTKPESRNQSTSANPKKHTKIITQKTLDSFYICFGLVSVVLFVILISRPTKPSAAKTASADLPYSNSFKPDTISTFKPINADSISKQLMDEAVSKNLSKEIELIRKKNAKHLKSNYFTIGSTKDEVTRIQGTPTSITGPPGYEEWSYGLSSIVFIYGKMRSYNNFANNLRVRLTEPSQDEDNSTDQNDNYYTIGSTKGTVIRIQGTPTSITGPSGYEEWSYGLSDIIFVYGKVKSFNNFEGNLHIRIKSMKKD